MTGVDQPAEKETRHRTDQRGERESAAECHVAFAERQEQRDLPDEIISGGDPAIGQKQRHAGNGCLEGAGRMARDSHVGRDR